MGIIFQPIGHVSLPILCVCVHGRTLSAQSFRRKVKAKLVSLCAWVRIVGNAYAASAPCKMYAGLQDEELQGIQALLVRPCLSLCYCTGV